MSEFAKKWCKGMIFSNGMIIFAPSFCNNYLKR